MSYAIDALAGRNIFVAEDEYLLADIVTAAIQSAGGEVHGPFASSAAALAFLETARPLPDAAILNVGLLDGPSFPVADALTAADVPLMFASGRRGGSLPSRFSDRTLLPKPFVAADVVDTLSALLQSAEPGEPARGGG